jgi:hypothetical protein
MRVNGHELLIGEYLSTNPCNSICKNVATAIQKEPFDEITFKSPIECTRETHFEVIKEFFLSLDSPCFLHLKIVFDVLTFFNQL